MTITDLTGASVATALGNGLKTLAGYIGAIGVILAVIWYAVEPRVTKYLEDYFAPLNEQLASLTGEMAQMRSALREVGTLPVVEVPVVMLLIEEGPFKAGQNVRVLAFLRRNNPCPTTVEVRFWSANLGGIDSSLTYLIPATRASITSDFLLFPVNVRLPDHMPPGRYSYVPILTPDGCNGVSAIHVPPSEFFEVVR